MLAVNVILQQKISNALNNKRWCVLSSIDFAKAYDKLPIAKLMSKFLKLIKNKQIAALVYNMIRGRRIAALASGKYKTGWEKPLLGIPQGSAISCTLYALWVSDLSEVLKDNKDTISCQFADDTNVFTSSDFCEIEAVQRQIDAVKNIEEWCIKN